MDPMADVLGAITRNSSNVALLVLSPEHYDWSGDHFVGSQSMRVTHLAIMGFKVMCVNLQMANKLMMHCMKLRY